jgi:transcriptional regulator with XRE-family HTH domain
MVAYHLLQMSDQVTSQPLAERRQAQRLSRERLAALAGVSTATVTRLERGDVQRPHRASLLLLATALGCRPEDLIIPTNSNAPAHHAEALHNTVEQTHVDSKA